jgi:hypothetical protein
MFPYLPPPAQYSGLPHSTPRFWQGSAWEVCVGRGSCFPSSCLVPCLPHSSLGATNDSWTGWGREEPLIGEHKEKHPKSTSQTQLCSKQDIL